MKVHQITCPYCGDALSADTTVCPTCQEDLAALARIEHAPAIHYNQALALAREGDLVGAGRQVAAALALDGDLQPGHLLAAKIAAREGRWSDASASAARAVALAPEDADAQAVVQELARLAQEQAAQSQAQAAQQRERSGAVARAYRRDVTSAFVFGLGIAGAIATLVSLFKGRHPPLEEEEENE